MNEWWWWIIIIITRLWRPRRWRCGSPPLERRSWPCGWFSYIKIKMIMIIIFIIIVILTFLIITINIKSFSNLELVMDSCYEHSVLYFLCNWAGEGCTSQSCLFSENPIIVTQQWTFFKRNSEHVSQKIIVTQPWTIFTRTSEHIPPPPPLLINLSKTSSYIYVKIIHRIHIVQIWLRFCEMIGNILLIFQIPNCIDKANANFIEVLWEFAQKSC